MGRSKWNGEIEIPDNLEPDDIAGFAYREAGKHLASAYPEAIYNAETNEGRIYAGFHCVGSFAVVPTPESADTSRLKKQERA